MEIMYGPEIFKSFVLIVFLLVAGIGHAAHFDTLKVQDLTNCDVKTDGDGQMTCGSDDDSPDDDSEVPDAITVNPINATTESAIESVVDLQDCQGAVTDAQVPQVGAVTSGKWCVGDGDSIECDQNEPVTSESDPTVDTADEIEAILKNDNMDFGTGIVSTANQLRVGNNLPGKEDLIDAGSYITTYNAVNKYGLYLLPYFNPGGANANWHVGIGGYAAFQGANFGSGANHAKVIGLSFSPWTHQNSGGSTTLLDTYGIVTYGSGASSSTFSAATVTGLEVQPWVNGWAGILNCTTSYGINVLNSDALGTGGTMTTAYGIHIAEPTRATTNYQLVLSGHGDGSGIWFDAAERVYSDGTGLVVTPEIKLSDTNTGGNEGTNLCIGADNTVCRCGTCN